MTTPGTQGEVSPESMGKTASSAVGSPPDAKPASPCTAGNTADQNRLKPCKGKPFNLSNEGRKSKRKSRLNRPPVLAGVRADAANASSELGPGSRCGDSRRMKPHLLRENLKSLLNENLRASLSRLGPPCGYPLRRMRPCDCCRTHYFAGNIQPSSTLSQIQIVEQARLVAHESRSLGKFL